MNNKSVGEYLVMYTVGKGKDEHVQYESHSTDWSAWAAQKKIIKQKGVNRDTVTVYKQL